MRIVMPIVVACATLVSATTVAQVVKCAGERGQPVYQDQPCAPGRELRNFTVDPPTLSVIPARPIPGTTTRVATPPVAKKERPAPVKREVKRTGDPAERKYIHPGMHEGEVVSRIGSPDLKSGGGGRRLARWTYMPVLGDPQTLTTVVFDYGKVVEVERKVMK